MHADEAKCPRCSTDFPAGELRPLPAVVRWTIYPLLEWKMPFVAGDVLEEYCGTCRMRLTTLLGFLLFLFGLMGVMVLAVATGQ